MRAAATDPVGLPVFLSGGEDAVMIVHGFTGITGELRYAAERLWERGYTVSLPRLPGHGTWGEDFLRTGRRDWLRRAEDEYLDLACRFRRVHLVGLSMGALLVLLIGSRYETGKLVLAAPAVTNTDRTIRFAPLLRRFRPVLPKDDYRFSGPPEQAGIAREYWSRTWVAPAAELYRLQKEARKALPRVGAEALIIVSEADDTVPLEAADIVEGGMAPGRTRRVVLRESGHVVLNDVERERALDEIIRWLEDASPGRPL